jgi:hypothetical protein
MYHDPEKRKTKDRFYSLLKGPVDVMPNDIPDFQNVLYDISKCSDTEIKGTITARVGMVIFKHIFDQDISPGEFQSIVKHCL